MANYMKWLDEAKLLVEHEEDVKELLKQIWWIQNLTNTTKAQEIFEIWYNEMVRNTEYDIIIDANNK